MIADNKKDLLWILIVSVLILLWSSIPTWAGYWAETKDLRFRGLYYDSQDYAAHIAMMEAGMHGAWTYQFQFTTEPLQPAYVRIFYIALGHCSKWLGLAPEFTFQLAHWLFGLVALYTLYKLSKQICNDIFWARVAFLLAALGSGLGWLQLIFNLTSTQITPIDFWLIDSYVFFSLSVFPHFAFVTAAMCITLGLWLNYLEKMNSINIFWIALVVIVIQFTNPIAFAAIDAGFLGAAFFSWWNKRKISGPDIVALSIIASAQFPLLVYNLIVLIHDPLWSQYTSQHQTLSPPPDYYLWGFGFFWPFAIWGALFAFRERSSFLGAAIFWTFAAFSLAYAPLYTQQRFLQNITIPLAILATYGLRVLFESRTFEKPELQKWAKSIVILFLSLASLSSIQLGLGRVLYLQTHPQDFYYPASLDKAIEWLRNNAQYDDFVLASEATSQILAQKAGVRVYGGHEMETLDYQTKKMNVRAFFQSELPELAKQPVKWVVYGPFEKELSPNFRPADNLDLVYDTQALQIYQVK
jgi:hypothetical protein